MELDLPTLLKVEFLVFATAAGAFTVNTVMRDNDAVGRIWSVAFLLSLLSIFAYLVWSSDPSSLWWAVGVGNAAFVVAVGLIWCGARWYNGRRPLLWVVSLLGLFTLIAALLPGLESRAWSGNGEGFLAVTVAALLAAAECFRGRMRTVLSARFLGFVYFAFAAFYLTRLVLLLAAGRFSLTFERYVGTDTATLVNIFLVIVTATSTSALQSVREPEDGLTDRQGKRIPGVLGPTLFAELASDSLQRARAVLDPLVLVLVDIDNLPHITSAFGRGAAERAVIAVGRTACLNAPPSTLVGRSTESRFVILTTMPAIGSPEGIAERIQDALVESPIDALDGLRATASWAVTTTTDEGYDLAALMGAAEGALAGPGTGTGASVESRST